MRKHVILTLTALALVATASASATTIPVDPLASFLRTDSWDTAIDAVPIDISTLGYGGGDWIFLTQMGDYAAHDYDTVDRYTAMLGVFSETADLLGPDQAHRVPGAIEAGDDFVTEITYHEDHVTDIPEDFWIDDTPLLIQIPWDAHFLFVATMDDFYGDNHQNTVDFAVDISPASPPVPEPATIALLGLGIAGMAARGMRRR